MAASLQPSKSAACFTVTNLSMINLLSPFGIKGRQYSHSVVVNAAWGGAAAGGPNPHSRLDLLRMAFTVLISTGSLKKLSPEAVSMVVSPGREPTSSEGPTAAATDGGLCGPEVSAVSVSVASARGRPGSRGFRFLGSTDSSPLTEL